AMTDTVVNPRETSLSATTAARITMALVGIVFLLMMALGLAMRLTQAAFINLSPELFYEIMTAHGVGMVGAAGLGGAAIMWFFLNRPVEPNIKVFYLFLAFFLLGVVLILGGVFLGGFGAAWTFLFPLPALSGGVWSPAAALAFIVGLLSVGVAF